MSEPRKPIPKATLLRLPAYLRYLQGKRGDGNISSAAIAEDLNLNAVSVRKDLSLVARAGKPKTGYAVAELIEDLEKYFGYDSVTDAVLVGCGHLGTALLSYGGFTGGGGMNIVTAFDSNPLLDGQEIAGKPVFGLNRFTELVKRLNVKIGILAVPVSAAQETADLMISAGIRALWNFAPLHLVAPPEVLVKNEDLSASLALLARQLEEALKKDKKI